MPAKLLATALGSHRQGERRLRLMWFAHGTSGSILARASSAGQADFVRRKLRSHLRLRPNIPRNTIIDDPDAALHSVAILRIDLRRTHPPTILVATTGPAAKNISLSALTHARSAKGPARLPPGAEFGRCPQVDYVPRLENPDFFRADKVAMRHTILANLLNQRAGITPVTLVRQQTFEIGAVYLPELPLGQLLPDEPPTASVLLMTGTRPSSRWLDERGPFPTVMSISSI